jgi:predicted protein tyrosine phosphatase
MNTNKKKILFVCEYGEIRSPTCYDIYKEEFDCFYLNAHNIKDSSSFILYDFDIIIVMKDYLMKLFENTPRPIFNLDIEDNYGKRNHPKLIKLIKERMKSILELIRE